MSPNAVVRRPVAADLPAILDLHARAFGPGRFARAAYRVRQGTPPTTGICRMVEIAGRLVAALRMTPVAIGGAGAAQLLGPLAVEPAFEGQGFGRRLVRESLDAARVDGDRLVVLVGDEPYYGPLGFVRVPPGQIVFPGPADPARILAAELVPGALAGFRGLVVATS
jgi:predicted N-acetyltransferase YhbS